MNIEIKFTREEVKNIVKGHAMEIIPVDFSRYVVDVRDVYSDIIVDITPIPEAKKEAE